jgi:DNA-directed RNA polymerase specialized sigma24 family protein
MPKKITRRVMHAIDDVTCEVFLRLAQELGDPAIEDPQGSLCATLLEIEKECRAFAQDPAAPDAPRKRAAPRRQVEQALQSLTPDERDALFLHLGKGMTCLEISHQTGIPRESVLNDLVRAYSRLRLLLADDNIRNIC